MKIPAPRANVALFISILLGLLLFWYVEANYTEGTQWIPQFVVTLAGLIGAGWFVGHRLDLIQKDINQRRDAADGQLTASTKGNFNTAVVDAVKLMSDSKSLANVLAGQRWLHTLAADGSNEANLVRHLFCTFIQTWLHADPTSEDACHIRSSQLALRLLFHPTENGRYGKCADEPDLRSTTWRHLDFSGLSASGVNFTGGNFTDAKILATKFDDSNLANTRWEGEKVGGSLPTSMKNVSLSGAKGSSCHFINIDFSAAKFVREDRPTIFRHCIFERCSFENADWSGANFLDCKFIQCNFLKATWDGATLHKPVFDLCTQISYEQCKKLLKFYNPIGLSGDVFDQLVEDGTISFAEIYIR